MPKAKLVSALAKENSLIAFAIFWIHPAYFFLFLHIFILCLLIFYYLFFSSLNSILFNICNVQISLAVPSLGIIFHRILFSSLFSFSYIFIYTVFQRRLIELILLLNVWKMVYLRGICIETLYSREFFLMRKIVLFILLGNQINQKAMRILLIRSNFITWRSQYQAPWKRFSEQNQCLSDKMMVLPRLNLLPKMYHLQIIVRIFFPYLFEFCLKLDYFFHKKLVVLFMESLIFRWRISNKYSWATMLLKSSKDSNSVVGEGKTTPKIFWRVSY